MLKYRLIFGPILIALLVGVFSADHWLATHGWPKGMALLGLAGVAVFMAGLEFAQFLQAKKFPVSKAQVVAAALVGLVGMTLATTGEWITCILGDFPPSNTPGALQRWSNAVNVLSQMPLVAMTVFFLWTMFRHAQKTRSPEGALMAGGATLLSAVYLGVLTAFLLLIRVDFGIFPAIAVILVTKSCDIGAYFTGRAIGKNKLIPWISPGKTREGLAGGVAFSALVAVGFQQWTLPASVLGGGQVLPLCCWLQAAIFGAALAVLGQGGDLLASMFKRDAGVKDSGNSLPGFGGVIDVLDSPIAIAPIAYGALKILTYCASECGTGG